MNSQDHSFSVVKGLWQEQALDIANRHIDRCAHCCHGEGDFIALISRVLYDASFLSREPAYCYYFEINGTSWLLSGSLFSLWLTGFCRRSLNCRNLSLLLTSGQPGAYPMGSLNFLKTGCGMDSVIRQAAVPLTYSWGAGKWCILLSCVPEPQVENGNNDANSWNYCDYWEKGHIVSGT